MTRPLFALAISLIAALPGATFAAQREHVPAFRVDPGPPALPLGDDLAVVPMHQHRVWFAAGAFWTRQHREWFRAERRDEAWHGVALLSVPEVVRKVTRADEQRAQDRIARAERVAHWNQQPQPTRPPLRDVRAGQHTAKPAPQGEDAEEAARQAQWHRQALRTIATEARAR